MEKVIKPMRDTLLEEIYQAMKSDEMIFFVSADFGSPVLDKIRSAFYERFLNVGIAEQNLINVSTGLSLEGYKVFAYAIAPFITMRCYEQIRVNLALMSELRALNVNLIGVGAGYSYVVSGPTHQCYEDITVMRALPNIQLLSPSDWFLASKLVNICLEKTSVKYLRLDAQPSKQLYDSATSGYLEKGFHEFCTGGEICIISTGYMTHVALDVTQVLADDNIQTGILDIHDFSTFDSVAFLEALKRYKYLITLEEAFIGKGGLDSLVRMLVADNALDCTVIARGIPPHYQFELGDRKSHHERAGIGSMALEKTIRQLLKSGLGEQ